MKIKIASYVGVFVLGLLLGRLMQGDKTRRLTNFTQSELAEYLNESELLQNDRFRELSSQLILILHEDLQVKFVPKTIKLAGDFLAGVPSVPLVEPPASVDTTKTAQKSVATKPEPKASRKLSSLAPTKKVRKSLQKDKNKYPDVDDVQLKVAEQGLMIGASRAEFLENLQVLEMNHFEKQLKSLLPLRSKEPLIKNLIGEFGGSIEFLDSQKRWDVELDLEGDSEEGTFAGVGELKFKDKGHVFAEASFDGDSTVLRRLGEKRTGLLMRGPQQTYLQVYSTAKKDILVGNLYQKNYNGDFERKAAIFLHRK